MFKRYRLRNEARFQARNSATTYVYKYNLSQIVLLYLDFTGLRLIPEPKEDQISAYYSIVIKNIRARGGVKLYGGKDGDDAFTVLFTDPRPALQCAQDIKRDFSEELLLRGSKSDIKFGMCFTVFQNSEKEQEVIQCWGNAKDCCEFKSAGFRNRGDLIVAYPTLETIRRGKYLPAMDGFVPLADIRLKDGSQLFRFNKVEPLAN